MESSDSFLSASTPSSQSLSLSPSMTIMENMRDTPQPQYLKLEDLQSSTSPANTVFDSTSGSQQSPATVIIHSKPAKKRKSCRSHDVQAMEDPGTDTAQGGQALPTPTTNLPPRKRAKTEDEKEQRRIERIKRNRAAAHNSRERKRQETENLAVLLARARAELDAYRRLHGPLPSDVVLPEVTLNKDPESPGPLRYSDDTSSCMPSPATSLIDNIKQEPLEANTVSTMAMFEELDSKPSPLPTLDVTQHSAEMLCDLPCPSSLRSVRTTTALLSLARSRTSSRQSLTFQASPAWWATLFIYLTHLHIQTAYRQILLAIWSISPSRMQALISRAAAAAATTTTPSRTTKISLSATSTTLSSSTILSTQTPSQLLRSTQLLAQRNAATSRALMLARRSANMRAIRRSSGRVVAEDSPQQARPAAAEQDSIASSTRNGVQDDELRR